jgi:hypothetical protein
MMHRAGCFRTPRSDETSRPILAWHALGLKAEGRRFMILLKDSWKSKMDFALPRLRADGAGQ